MTDVYAFECRSCGILVSGSGFPDMKGRQCPVCQEGPSENPNDDWLRKAQIR